MTLETELRERLDFARHAARQLALASSDRKNRALGALAELLRESTITILDANREDLANAAAAGHGGAFVERLTLTPDRITAIAHSVEQVAALPDPVGETIARWRRPNGLAIVQIRVPLGVIAIIYESRPNVTIDAGVLGLKAGNAVVLRGGRESLVTNGVLAGLIERALTAADLDPHSVMFIGNPDREVVQILKRLPEAIDLIIPRGGNALKDALADSSVPLLPHFDGICHTYVDRAADLRKAEEICFNAKCSRPSVCNAMETLLVHEKIAPAFLPRMAERFREAGVELRGDERACALIPDALVATPEDWETEYLDLILSIKVVDSLEESTVFIGHHSSGLADAIVTEDEETARRFEREVDSATVYVNASTRFTDGFEFGFGAETGISTNRLHARGPMGLRELTTYKYVVRGDGQIRI
ncbi:MAG TPA: glutamate-5-semialdehyde dehydrogenase [Candidatus Binataceae bacterium]|nr:glutamate-5-semialdehyde dehydrogenase [Candidatus Binataceae bacterium]